MFIEAVTICVNFSDVLAHTLPLNKRHFDRMVVVSDTGDTATWALCRHHHVQCITTDEFYRAEHAFNKGRGINAGLDALAKTDWLVHLDADIVLPPRSREILEGVAGLEQANIYGIDRMMCPSFEAWIDHLTNPTCQHADEIFVVPEPFPMGSRVAKLGDEGYVPIGFFQLWHASAGHLTYPIEHGTAGRTDMLFAMQWARRNRVLLPELIGIHLEGRIDEGMRNWRGRQMGPFGRAPVKRKPVPGAYGG